MTDALADWSTESNNAVHISLVTPGAGGAKTLYSFNPKMTYSIFGHEERIFGYQGLKINLRYNACDMRPGLQITYNKKFKTVGETSPTDLKAILENYLPKTAFEKTAVFDAAISDSSYGDWKPPGELFKTIEDGGKTFEVWKGSLAHMAVQQMIKRIQILVPLFIEGGTFIELKDPEWSLERWTVFFLYEKNLTEIAPATSPYIFMGYSTVYRYFYYQSPKLPKCSGAEKDRIQHQAISDLQLADAKVSFSALPCRSRISQFVILPPFQGGGNGSRFYNAIYEYYFRELQTIEITVEDPNEAFDDLRDLNDLARLRPLPEFASLKINTNAALRTEGPVPRDIVDFNTLESIRTKVKIAPRQFARVTEMQLLSLIPSSIRQSLLVQHPKTTVPDLKVRQHEYHLWQLWVKKRLYRHNKDTLMQLDRAERIDKLDQALGGVEADYARLLRAFGKRQNGKGTDGNGSLAPSNEKRLSPNDKGDEEDQEPAAKKAKLTS